uniref:Uncharacterized protein n=1 Tax=Romanomermis culicivorax TaxID=13658 RepID=A0A915KUE4_ROMCU
MPDLIPDSSNARSLQTVPDLAMASKIEVNLADEISFVVKIVCQAISTNPSIALITLSPVGFKFFLYFNHAIKQMQHLLAIDAFFVFLACFSAFSCSMTSGVVND